MDAGPGDNEHWKQPSHAITPASGEIPMSYAEAKEIALLRQELRACWDRADRVAGRDALARLVVVAGATNDNELCAETRRWAARFDAA